MGRIGLLLLSMCLGANALAADQTGAQRQQTFGDTTVYYNAIPSTFLTEEIAKTVKVTRGESEVLPLYQQFSAKCPGGNGVCLERVGSAPR